jgi:hypothetical protein
MVIFGAIAAAAAAGTVVTGTELADFAMEVRNRCLPPGGNWKPSAGGASLEDHCAELVRQLDMWSKRERTEVPLIEVPTMRGPRPLSDAMDELFERFDELDRVAASCMNGDKAACVKISGAKDDLIPRVDSLIDAMMAAKPAP